MGGELIVVRIDIDYQCDHFAVISQENGVIAYAFLVMDGSHWELVPNNLNHKDRS